MSDIETIWAKLDEHNRELGGVKQELAALQARQDALEQRTDRLLQAQAEARAELKADMEQLFDRLSKISTAISGAKGGLAVGAWIMGTLTAVTVAAAALWNSVSGIFK